MTASSPADVRAVVGHALRAHGASTFVLAVSGGRDSMVLLHAAAASAPNAVRAVATFDHATGAHATNAADLVAATARALGIPVLTGRAERAGRTEAEWREARWRFLRACARDVRASAVATAHTRDDQHETIVMRALRGSAARGLAALEALADGIVRPLLTIARVDVAAYAEAHDVPWTADPANADGRHLRVRVRTALLPAVERVMPHVTGRVLALAESAARHRAAVEHWAARLCLDAPEHGTEPRGVAIVNESLHDASSGSARVLVSTIAGLDAASLGLFWPAFAARAGVRLDRRAIARLVAYTPRVAAHVRDGTAQPALVPVAGVVDPGAPRQAGTTGAVRHVVALKYASVQYASVKYASVKYASAGTGPKQRAWQFVVREIPAGDGHSAPGSAVGTRALRSSDYA